MKIKVEVDEAVLKVLVLEYIKERVNMPLVLTDLKIETKSKQNYRARAFARPTRGTYRDSP